MEMRTPSGAGTTSGDVGTYTASPELFKLMINSVLSGAGAKYVCFDIKIFTSTHH